RRLAGMLERPSEGKGGTGPVSDLLYRAHLAVRVHGPGEGDGASDEEDADARGRQPPDAATAVTARDRGDAARGHLSGPARRRGACGRGRGWGGPLPLARIQGAAQGGSTSVTTRARRPAA